MAKRKVCLPSHDRGNITLLGCVCLLFLSSFLCLNVKKQVEKLDLMNRQKNQILCALSYQQSLLTHVKKMEGLNRLIRVANLASYIPKTREAALASIKALELAQGVEAKLFIVKTSMIKKCSVLTRSRFFLNRPYHHNSVFQRSNDHQAIFSSAELKQTFYDLRLSPLKGKYDLNKPHNTLSAEYEASGGKRWTL